MADFQDQILKEAERLSESKKTITAKKYTECVKLLNKKMWINEKENILMKELKRFLYKQLGSDAVLVAEKYKPTVL